VNDGGAAAKFTRGVDEASRVLNFGVPNGEAAVWLGEVLEHFGPGVDRDRLVRDLFRNSDPVEALDLLPTVPEGSAKEGAAIGLACAISQGSVDRLVTDLLARGKPLAGEQAHLITLGLALKIDPAETARVFGFVQQDLSPADASQRFRASLDALKQLGESGVLEGEGRYDDFFSNAVSAAPFELWDSLSDERFISGLSGSVMDSELAGLVASMVMKDPESAIDKLVNSERYGVEARPELLNRALTAWLRKDETAALGWISGGSQIDRGVSSAAVARFYSNGRRFADAWSEVRKITDPALRRATEGRVWTAERNALRASVGQDPVGVLESLASGESEFAAYWMEEAMLIWMNRDAEAANAWYGTSWESLPKEKAQYVAAAFAGWAAEQGDIETARRWAAMILEEKTKARIQGVIEKAESGSR
jgi:hypothetical protein